MSCREYNLNKKQHTIELVTRMSCREYNLNKKQHTIELVFEGFELFTYS